MKCIKCSEDNKLKERQANNGKCKKCKHPFTFDPKLSDKFTDSFFAHTLDKISVNNSLYYTPRQFYYFLNVRRFPNKLLWPGFVALGAAILSLFIFGFFPAAFFVLAAIVLWLPAVRQALRPMVGRQTQINLLDATKLLQRWATNNGPLKKLLLPPEQKILSSAEVSQEVTAYSFDRAVICERTEIAHFLIANNFHFENNCAVLGLTGFPHNIFSTVMGMLRRNPELKVYALHDASAHGVQLVHRLRTDANWFGHSSGVTIYDLGLLPRQVQKKNMFVLSSTSSAQQAKTLPAEIRQTLQPAEIKWLEEGKSVELESLAPMMLLRIVRDGIAKSRNPEADDALVMVDSGGYSGSDVSVYSVDSFG